MKRHDADAYALSASPTLPAAAESVIAALRPSISDARFRKIEKVAEQRTWRVIPVLENIADPHNMAAVMRTADAMGVQEVHMIDSVDRPALASKKVARRSEQWLTRVMHKNAQACVEVLHARGYAIWVASMEGTLTPHSFKECPRVAVVFGNEHRGVSCEMRELADATYQIPMVGFVESMNISVAAAMTLHTAARIYPAFAAEDEVMRKRLVAELLYQTVSDAPLVVSEYLRTHVSLADVS